MQIEHHFHFGLLAPRIERNKFLYPVHRDFYDAPRKLIHKSQDPKTSDEVGMNLHMKSRPMHLLGQEGKKKSNATGRRVKKEENRDSQSKLEKNECLKNLKGIQITEMEKL